jgi:lysophospholipase L1-like esterase
LAAILRQQAGDKPPFADDIAKFEEADKVNPPKPGGIVFVGSSSIRLWKSLPTDFPGLNTINRGFGGSQISDSVRYAKRIVTPYKPRLVVFFAGTNDIAAGKSAQTVFSDFKSFVSVVRSELPNEPIIFLSITPAPSRWTKLDVFKEANALVQKYCQETPGLTFVDVFPKMLTPTGGPRPELFVGDQLHMNPKGYAIWVEAVKPLLEEKKG